MYAIPVYLSNFSILTKYSLTKEAGNTTKLLQLFLSLALM